MKNRRTQTQCASDSGVPELSPLERACGSWNRIVISPVGMACSGLLQAASVQPAPYQGEDNDQTCTFDLSGAVERVCGTGSNAEQRRCGGRQ